MSDVLHSGEYMQNYIDNYIKKYINTVYKNINKKTVYESFFFTFHLFMMLAHEINYDYDYNNFQEDPFYVEVFKYSRQTFYNLIGI
jgi:hypothetical protein